MILVFVNAVGDPQMYVEIVNLLKYYGYISQSQAETVKNIFYFLAYLGGLTVILGGLFFFIDRFRIATFFVSIGAGISITILALRAISLGPRLRSALEEGGLKAFISVLLGLSYGLRLLGTLLAFLALLRYYVPLLLGALASIGYLASGAVFSISLEGISSQYASVTMAGIAILVISLIGSAGYLKLERILSALVLMLYIPTFILRSFGGFFNRRTFFFALEAMFFTLLMIVWTPGAFVRILEKMLRRK